MKCAPGPEGIFAKVTKSNALYVASTRCKYIFAVVGRVTPPEKDETENSQ